MPGPEIEKMTSRCCGQRASRPDPALVKASIGVLAGLFLALSGLATYVFFPTILKTQVELNLVLEEGNEVYTSWQRPPVPIYIKYYFFNYTNPDEYLAGTEKPRLEEHGPYTFLETREKVNITWNDNGTVSYRQVKRYYFQPDMTKGSLDDVITTVNMPMINLVLEEGNEVYTSWQRPPVPIYVKYYFFNYTNPDEYLAGTEKPRLEEHGPYTFLETREKVNITWNDNGTVSYRQVKRYYFQPDMTKGSLDDVITTVNMPMISSAYVVRYAPDDFFREAVTEIFEDTHSTLFVRKPVRELLYEGYEERILSIAKSMDFPVPSTRFRWLEGKNDTDDGEYTIFTGTKGMHNYGTMDKYNGLNETSAYRGYCNMINGTVGDLWPPVALENQDNITLFVPDFCRSIQLDFLGDVETRGVKLRRYFAGGQMFNYTSRENRCFCDQMCLPPGALNVSSCIKGPPEGTPVIITFPHFLHAHPFYQTFVDGVKPDPKKHQMYIDIEPKMGITVNAAAKFQVNVWIENIPGVLFFKDVPRRQFFPVFWFENLASADKSLLSRLRLVTEELPQYVTVGAFGAVIIGGVILLTTLVYAIRYTKKPKPVQPTYIPVRVLK